MKYRVAKKVIKNNRGTYKKNTVRAAIKRLGANATLDLLDLDSIAIGPGHPDYEEWVNDKSWADSV